MPSVVLLGMFGIGRWWTLRLQTKKQKKNTKCNRISRLVESAGRSRRCVGKVGVCRIVVGALRSLSSLGICEACSVASLTGIAGWSRIARSHGGLLLATRVAGGSHSGIEARGGRRAVVRILTSRRSHSRLRLRIRIAAGARILRGTVDAGVRWRHVRHEDRVGSNVKEDNPTWWCIRKHVVGHVEAVLGVVRRHVRRRRGCRVRTRRCAVWRGVRRHEPGGCPRRKLTALAGLDHGLTKLDGTALHEFQFERALPVTCTRLLTIHFRLHLSLDVVSPEDGLLQLQVGDGEEGEAKGQQCVLGVLVCEDHLQSINHGEIESSFLGARKAARVLPFESEVDAINVEENAETTEAHNAQCC
ncbi:unnamed protein product, partial [Ixodes pacificus]